MASEVFHPDLLAAKKLVYDTCAYTFSALAQEKESSEYGACTFTLNTSPVKFRTAKITPTKVGQFVTLWKRNNEGITQPHDHSDLIDYYVISVRDQEHFGQFVFPRSVLIQQNILSSAEKEGKRGFRVYPPWDKAENKQAQRTQKWQLEFFLDITTGELKKERVHYLYSQK